MPVRPQLQDRGSRRRSVRGVSRSCVAVLAVFAMLAIGCDATPRGAPPPVTSAHDRHDRQPEPSPPPVASAAPADQQPASHPDTQQDPNTFRVVADEFVVEPPRIRVRSGATVTITFVVKTERVYFGGIDFRSDVIDTDTILAGTEKTITFTAPGRSFTFLAYWPSTGVPKEARLDVDVE